MWRDGFCLSDWQLNNFAVMEMTWHQQETTTRGNSNHMQSCAYHERAYFDITEMYTSKQRYKDRSKYIKMKKQLWKHLDNPPIASENIIPLKCLLVEMFCFL